MANWGVIFDIIYLSRVAGIEEKCCAFQTDPVTLPASFSCQLHLMFLPEEPLLDAEEARLPHGPGAVEGGPSAALFGLVVTACNDSLYDSCDSLPCRGSCARSPRRHPPTPPWSGTSGHRQRSTTTKHTILGLGNRHTFREAFKKVKCNICYIFFLWNYS